MSVDISDKTVCAIADAALQTPMYYSLSHLRLSRFVAEQNMVRSNTVMDSPFSERVPGGERSLEISIEGLSDNSVAENLIVSAVMNGLPRRIRLDDVQGNRLEGVFWVTRFQKEAVADKFERINVDLRSDGAVTYV